MVSEDSETHGCQRSANPLHLSQARSVVAIHAIPKISRENRRVMRRGAHEFFDGGRQLGVEIAMKVAELKQAEPVERRRQRRKFPLLRDELNIQKSSPQGLTKTEELQDGADSGIERDQSLESKNSLALVLELCPLAGLPFQALLEKPVAKTLAEIPRHAGMLDQRITRPSWPGFSAGLGT